MIQSQAKEKGKAREKNEDFRKGGLKRSE